MCPEAKGMRGVIVGKLFTQKQLQAIELLATGEHSNQDVAAAVKVTPSTISHWKQNYQFIDAIIRRAREMLKEALPDLYMAGVKQAKTGSAPHLKIILDHLERLENLRSDTGTIVFKWEE
jgi:DNA-binding CsgD family transcriptional regulator